MVATTSRFIERNGVVHIYRDVVSETDEMIVFVILLFIQFCLFYPHLPALACRWSKFDPKVDRDLQWNIEKPSHSLHHEYHNKASCPYISSYLQRAISIHTSLYTSFTSEFKQNHNTKQSYPGHWNSLLIARRTWALLQRVSVRITLPFSAVMFGGASTSCSKDLLVGNRAHHSRLLGPWCTIFCTNWSTQPTDRMYWIYNSHYKPKIGDASIVQAFDRLSFSPLLYSSASSFFSTPQ